MTGQDFLGLTAEGELDGARRAGLRDELVFWRSLFDRSNTNRLEKLLSHVPAGSVVRVLDVGSGPLTHVGTVSGRWRAE